MEHKHRNWNVLEVTKFVKIENEIIRAEKEETGGGGGGWRTILDS